MTVKLILGRILHIEQGVVLYLSFAGLIMCNLLVFAQVVNRYWLHFEIMWFGDLALYVFIGFMFIATVVATWEEGHVAVDYLRVKVLQGRLRGLAIHHVSMTVLSVVVVCVFLFPVYQFMLRALKYPEYGTLVRWFNISWLQVVLFVILILVLVHLLIIAYRDIGNLIKIWHSRR